ncbi:MAG: nucleotide exchange factor GrpE [Patescibacteria group bacterium]
MDEENDLTIESEEEGENIQNKIKKIKEELKNCQKEKEEYLTGWQRAKADFINARKEEEENRKELIKSAEENLIKELLAVLDGFEAAFEDKSWQTLDKNWQDGLKSLYNQFLDTFKKYNLTLIDSQGKIFDPQEHEAIDEIEVNNQEMAGKVVKELRKGYKINQKVLRPAQVRVGRYKLQ